MKRIRKKLKNSNKVMLSFYIISILVFISSIVLVDISIIKLSGIETTIRYIIIIVLILLLILLINRNYNYVVKRKKVKFIITTIITLLLSSILFISTYFINVVYGNISNLSEKEKIVYTSYLITLNDTKITTNSTLGMISDESDIEGYILAKDIIKKNKLKGEVTYYDTYSTNGLIDKLYSKEVDGIFVSSNYVSLFESAYPTIMDDTKVVYKYSKLMNNKDLNLKSSKKKLTEPFTILLMGVDTDSESGVEANSSFNGDTLMLVSFNPNTLNATVFSIPRDLYVPISCRNNAVNKINSSAAGGTECVINTIENLTTLNIDYYAKINFRGVVDLVDALGGVDIDVENAFCEQDSHRSYENELCLSVGYQHVNGEEALAFARHRHSLPTGDLMRIQNQQKLVEAMARKLATLDSVSDFNDILSAVSNNISVNMDTNQILSSYDILKDMISNTLNGAEMLTLNRTYLEVYDNPVYLPNGTYLSTLGLYQKSLDDIIKTMKINLELEDPELIKTFYYDANTEYVKSVAGKNIKTSDNNVLMKDFTGKSVSEVESFCKSNSIELTKEYVDSSSDLYNSSISSGLVAHQSVKEGIDVVNISKMTIYINSTN